MEHYSGNLMSQYKQPHSPQNYVADILNHKIYLNNISDQVIDAIKEIGAFQDEITGQPVWLIHYGNDKELAEKLHELNKLGFLFVGEPAGWPPAEVFDHIRKKNLLSDNFKEVRWRGPGDWYILDR